MICFLPQKNNLNGSEDNLKITIQISHEHLKVQNKYQEQQVALNQIYNFN